MTRRPRLMAWSLAAIAIGLFALGVTLNALGSSTRGPQLSVADISLFVAFLSYAVVGALVASRKSGNPIGWLLLAEGLLFQLVSFSVGYVRFALFDGPGDRGGAAFVAWLGNSVWIPVLVVAAFIFLLFPTGHFLSRRWRLVAWAGLTLAGIGFVSEAVQPGPMDGSLSDLQNPFGIPGADGLLATVGAVSTALAGPLLLGAALLSFLLRFRAADGTLRQQLHWLAYAALVLVGGFVLGDLLKALGLPSSVYALCYLLPLAGVPVAIGIAILRHRLYEIQVVINGTVTAAAVAGFAVAVYGVLVVGVGAVVGSRTGSNVILASIATAVVAFAFPFVLTRARTVGRRIAYGAPSPHERETGIAVRCLGAFMVFRDGRPVPATAWQSKKARSLLKILIARRGRSTPRAMLMEMLWPDDDPAKLANRLSVALATVRAVLDPDKAHPADHYIAAGKDSMRLELERVAVDVEDFLAGSGAALSLVREGRRTEGEAGLNRAAAMYAGDFLEEDLYEDWSVDLRDEACAVYLEVVRWLAEISRDAGHPDAAIVHYLRLLAKDPWDEGAHISLVRTLAGSGRHGEARRYYRGYAARMGELDLPVSGFPT